MSVFLKFIWGILLIIGVNSRFYAQWPALASPNVPITNQAATTDAANYWAASDGVGGSFAVWEDDRNDPGGQTGIFCQRMQSFGVAKFVANGIQISDIAGSNQKRPWVSAGTNSTALIVWEDERNSGTTLDDIYAKSIDSSGTTLWGGANGIVVCSAVNDQERPQIVSDGAGGAIIVWRDRRMGGRDIYAQRINSLGVVQWSANGVVICDALGTQSNFSTIEDGLGGAIIVWEDDRNSTTDIFAQKIDSSGVVQWAANGLSVCTNSANDQLAPVLVTDDAGGAIIAWEDKRLGRDIYAQRVSSVGVVQWAVDGIIICNATNNQSSPAITSDAFGGAIITWDDMRNSGVTSNDVYSQRVNATGAIQWAANGVVICDNNQSQRNVHSCKANNGSVLIVWEDNRNTAFARTDIYVELLALDGTTKGGVANGIQVCDNIRDQGNPFIFANGSSEWIILWQDDRNDPGGNDDIYSQGLNPTFIAALPIELLSFDAYLDENKVIISWITATEINNDYFIVERSKDGNNWEYLLTTSGAGNSNQIIQYLETDYQPLKDISYYRLKQVDFDGGFSYSDIITVKYVKNKAIGSFNLFPNPTNIGETINLEFKEINEEDLLLVLRDVSGKEFYSKVIMNIEDGKVVGIPLNMEIPSGIYLITATSNNQVYSQKLMIK